LTFQLKVEKFVPVKIILILCNLPAKLIVLMSVKDDKKVEKRKLIKEL